MNYVRDAAQTGSMTPGTWYSVYRLSEELGISRSPVRDGLLRLEEAGLIEFSRNRGFQIVETKPSDVADIFDVRLALEPRIAARAALQRSETDIELMHEILEHMAAANAAEDEPVFFDWDVELHNAILHAGNSRRGAQALETLRTHTRILADSTVRTQRSMDQVQSEHVPIVKAIERGDAQAAAHAMQDHLTATGRLLLTQTILHHNPGLEAAALESAVDEIWQRHIGDAG